MAQSTLCIVLGLIGSFAFRRQAARAHRALLLGMLMSLGVPLLSLGVNHLGLGLLEAAPQENLSTPASDTRVRHNNNGLMTDSGQIAPSDTDIGQISALVAEPPSPVVTANSPGIASTEFGKQPVSKEPGKTMTRGQWLFGIWGLVTGVLLLRLIRTFVLGLRLLHRAETVEDDPLSGTLSRVCTELGVRPNISIRVSSTVKSPIIWCWSIRPILLIPTGTDHLTQHTDWLGLFTHEVAHWKRRDHWVGLISELAVCVVWWDPLLWWARQRLLFLSEQACDDWVLASGQEGPDYAELLLSLLPEGRMAFVPTVVGKENTMKARIHRIIKHEVTNPTVGFRWALIALLVTLCVAAGTAFAQRRPADASRQAQLKQQEHQKELMEAIHYLETRIKLNAAEIHTLEQNGRGQGVKAKILREEMRRVRAQLRELAPGPKHDPPAKNRPRATNARKASPPKGNPPEVIVPLKRRAMMFDERADESPKQKALQAREQALRQERLENLKMEREKLAQTAERVASKLHESDDNNPELRQALQQELAQMHMRMDQMSVAMEDQELSLQAKNNAQSASSRSVLQQVREFEEQAKRQERELKKLQNRGEYDEARAQQKQLQATREHIAQAQDKALFNSRGRRRAAAQSEDQDMMAIPPALPAQAGLQDQLNTLHGRMDQLTRQMQELHLLLQKVLEREEKYPSLYDVQEDDERSEGRSEDIYHF